MTRTAAKALQAAETHYYRLKAAIERAENDPDVELDDGFWRALDTVSLTIQAEGWKAEGLT